MQQQDSARMRRIERYLSGAPQEDLQVLVQITNSQDKAVGNDVYYSIVTGISYEHLNEVNSVLTSKRNFYRIKSKCVEEFGKYLDDKLAQSDKLD